MRYHCLFRSRMAKADVLRRVLERKVSDGRWEGVDDNQRSFGVMLFNALRESYRQGFSLQTLLETPGLSVFYLEDVGCHVVELEDTRFPQTRGQSLLLGNPTNEQACR